MNDLTKYALNTTNALINTQDKSETAAKAESAIGSETAAKAENAIGSEIQEFGQSNYQTQYDTLPSGNDPALMEHIKGWNWGAFFFNWIWLIPINIGLAIVIFFANMFTCGLANLIFSIYLGIKGNELAWTNVHFRDVEEFKEIQKRWSIAGLVCVFLPMIGASIFVILCAAVFFSSLVSAIQGK